MLLVHEQECVDANLHPPIYFQEGTCEVFQDFLIPKTKHIGLSPFQLAWGEGREIKFTYGYQECGYCGSARGSCHASQVPAYVL